jgi:geranylgeranyl diphosphate synthase type II
MPDYRQKLRDMQGAINARLETYFTQSTLASSLTEAMRYSVLAGGKRLRPAMALAFCESTGGDVSLALDAACAVELLHTYSLIHDDLPCMDDDDLRRGKPTSHRVFGEWRAVLAGDALQAAAFEKLLQSDLPAERVVQMARVLADAAGVSGICGGQTLDMESEGEPVPESVMTWIHERKTAALFIASAKLGVIAAGGDGRQLDAAERYARCVGVAFQVRDDMLDATAQTIDMGKPRGSDEKNNKTTFLTLFGESACQMMVEEQTRLAVSALDGVFPDVSFLTYFADFLAGREN